MAHPLAWLSEEARTNRSYVCMYGCAKRVCSRETESWGVVTGVIWLRELEFGPSRQPVLRVGR